MINKNTTPSPTPQNRRGGVESGPILKKAIICHGVAQNKEYFMSEPLPSCAKNWIPWLQKKFLIHGMDCQTPAFPNSWIPARDYNDDVKVFERFDINENTTLVGHSCGTGFLLKYLSTNPHIKIRHLVLVAPSINMPDIQNYEIVKYLDKNLPDRIWRIDLFISDNEPIQRIRESAEQLIKMYPSINVHRFQNHGHFTEGEMGTKEFPELWEVCKSEI